MSVKIKPPEYLQDKTGGEPVGEVTANTLRECLEGLFHRRPGLKGEIAVINA